ncbi:hypothetical protein M422DRAFT_194750, partial [Sphaerobolus stellatus SS14]
TIPTMDVSKNDPSAIFIRLPLVVPYPRDGEEVQEGDPMPGTPLTYAIMHMHRNWFLDSDDFRKDNSHRIDYPSELEPPRGWAPREKNNIRTKGSYTPPSTAATIEYGPSDECHEKTVLRCTFCRREYHGPNAKSMWRRHVFDKHKVAMKNRREGSAGTAPRLPAPKKGRSKPGTGTVQEGPLVLSPPPSLDSPQLTLDLTSKDNHIAAYMQY